MHLLIQITTWPTGATSELSKRSRNSTTRRLRITSPSPSLKNCSKILIVAASRRRNSWKWKRDWKKLSNRPVDSPWFANRRSRRKFNAKSSKRRRNYGNKKTGSKKKRTIEKENSKPRRQRPNTKHGPSPLKSPKQSLRSHQLPTRPWAWIMTFWKNSHISMLALRISHWNSMWRSMK